MNRVVGAIREHIRKKTKQDIKPNDIKQHFMLILDCIINNPRYSSQTKDTLLTEPSQYGSTFELTDKTIRKIIKSEIVEEIIEWAQRKKELEDLRAVKKLEKELDKSSLRKIEKYNGATSKDRSKCSIIFAEGDSACAPLSAVIDKEYFGTYSLGGKPRNVRDVDIKTLMASEKFTNIINVIGLRIGEKAGMPDGDWLVVEIDGKEYIINENDEIASST
jgi:DNA topoisomerase-2